jgi:hypothetical protein
MEDLTKLTNDQLVGKFEIARLSLANLRRDRMGPQAFADVMGEVALLEAEVRRRNETV